MLRRGLALTLLLLVALQLAGAMAFVSVCEDQCPDDTETSSCPPICALCTTCTHSQQAIVQRDAANPPVLHAQPMVTPQRTSGSLQLAADIFHVPLFG